MKAFIINRVVALSTHSGHSAVVNVLPQPVIVQPAPAGTDQEKLTAWAITTERDDYIQ